MALALGYANGNSGYLCTAAAMFEGGYEPARAYKYYLRPGPFAPEIEPTLIQTALDLAKRSPQRSDRDGPSASEGH